MDIFAVTIKPETPFGTPLKGDTLFGQFCWQAVQKEWMLADGFDHWISQYQFRPFAVFSSAWPKIIDANGYVLYCLPKPSMPSNFSNTTSRRERAESRKAEKAKKWLLVPETGLNDVSSCTAVSDKELFITYRDALPESERRRFLEMPENMQRPVITAGRTHNAINRRTMTTGKGFDPYTMENLHFLPGIELVIFVALDPDALGVNELRQGLVNIGAFGFGRDASSGLGRFSISGEIVQLNWPTLRKDQWCYVLAPCVPEPDRYLEYYALPFTRFGRHGDRLVLSKNPFKNPIVMADDGAVFFPKKGAEPTVPYIGRGVSGLSLVEPKTVAQGYGLYLPLTRSMT